MQIYEELVARGLIAQVTDEKEIRELINGGKAVFYIGATNGYESEVRETIREIRILRESGLI